MSNKLASEAAITRAYQRIIPQVQDVSNKNQTAVEFFQKLISNGIDSRDQFKTRNECLDLISKIDADLHCYLQINEGAFRDLDIFNRGESEDVGMTGLMWACVFNWEIVCRSFIELGSDTNLKLNCDRNVLMVCAWRGSSSLITIIAHNNPQLLGQTDINRDSALITALSHDRHEAVIAMIESDSALKQLDYDTGLMKAIELGRTQSALSLVSKVTDINMGPRKTPYIYKAAWKGNHEIVEFLIKNRAIVDIFKASMGVTALMEATRQGHKKIVEVLLENKADPNLISSFEEDDDTGYTALHFAARFNHYEIIEILKRHGANIYIESQKRHFTPYVIAIRFKSFESQQLLATGKCDLPILLEAVNSQNARSVDHLLTTSTYEAADVNEALVAACSLGYDAICEVLLSKFGADANSMQKESGEDEDTIQFSSKTKTNKQHMRFTPLSCVLLASMKGHLKIVELLLKYNANFLQQDANESTAIHYVMACNPSPELIDNLMERYGMSAFTKKDKQSRTPIYYANNEETLIHLLSLNEDPQWLTKADEEKTKAFQYQQRNLRVTSETLPEAVLKFKSLKSLILDKTIQPVGYGPHDQNLEVKIDFSILYKSLHTTKKNRLAEDVLETLLKNKPEALSHPTIKLFLLKKSSGFPKWYSRCQFWLFFLLAVTFTCGAILTSRDGNNQDKDNDDSSVDVKNMITKGSLIGALILTGLCILFELLTLDEKGWKYFSMRISWFRILNYIGSIVCSAYNLTAFVDTDDGKHSNKEETLDAIMRALSSFIILGLFFNLLLVLRRSALFGIYVSIFCNVLQNVVTLIVPIGLLITAFSSAFFCLYTDNDPYNDMSNTGFKVVSMMMGSIEPEEVAESFASNWPIFIAQCTLFVTFLIFMAVITMNLLIGIAISDVAAEIPLAKQTHLIQLTQHIVQSENIARAFPLLDKFCYKKSHCSFKLNSFKPHQGICQRIMSCLAPKSTPQFEQEIIEEIKEIVDQIYVQSTNKQ